VRLYISSIQKLGRFVSGSISGADGWRCRCGIEVPIILRSGISPDWAAFTPSSAIALILDKP